MESVKWFGKTSLRKAKKVFRKERGARYPFKNYLFQVKVGDFVHECDRFNHRISKVEDYYGFVGCGWVLIERELYSDYGGRNRLLCNCPQPKEPWSKEKIEQEILAYDTPRGWQMIKEWRWYYLARAILALTDGIEAVSEFGEQIDLSTKYSESFVKGVIDERSINLTDKSGTTSNATN